MSNQNEPFYLRYYSGHSGRFGHEFLEFDFRTLGDGRSAAVRYANNSNYRNDSLIRKEMCVSSAMIQEVKRIIKESEIMKEDDSKWPQKNKDGRQELEIRLGNEHISFETAKIGSFVDVTESADPEGLRVFYYLVQDLKALIFSLISLHFKMFRPQAPIRLPRARMIRLSLSGTSMPTPSDNTSPLNVASITEDISTHTTCPPEVERLSSWRDSPEPSATESDVPDNASSPSIRSAHTLLTAQPDGTINQSNTDVSGVASGHTAPEKGTMRSDDEVALGRLSPTRGTASSAKPTSTVASPSTASLLSYEFSNVRLLPNYTSSYLRPGSKFTGTQQSDRQVYNVDVEIKHVDMAESYLCGYLRIQGLTEDHPTLTTFFEGEIIGTKHTFKTRNEAWGATEKTDMHHWARFPAWRPLAKQAKKPDFTYWNFAEREHIFMRWKEYFLVPDHRVRTISGASFEGFYYICFNQIEGSVTGIYFHAKSEKYVSVKQLTVLGS
ncbi:hypothetical protein EMGR_008322 [Emarellia grisea]